jgi:hypothetical protein
MSHFYHKIAGFETGKLSGRGRAVMKKPEEHLFRIAAAPTLKILS